MEEDEENINFKITAFLTIFMTFSGGWCEKLRGSDDHASREVMIV
jgi:hypothetical protein